MPPPGGRRMSAMEWIAIGVRTLAKVACGPCMDGARGAREKNLTFCEAFGCSHVYGLFSLGGLPPCDAATLAAGPDVIR
jgi:hypothetical protein